MPPLLTSSDTEDSSPEPTFKINESYAARLEHNKKREELHRLEAKYGKSLPRENDQQGSDEESSSESEDEAGELVTPQLDAEIWRTIAMIRERRPEVYDENFKVFKEDEEVPKTQKEKKEKPMYLKDYHRRNLLAGDTEVEPPQPQSITTYEQEQKALRAAFHTTIPSDEEDEEEEIFKPKKRSKNDSSKEEAEYASFLASTLKDEASQKMLQQLQSLASQPSVAAPTALDVENPEEGEAFLAKYLLNRGWLDPETSHPELYEDASSDEEKAEHFETSYNFRFEAPGAAEIVTHARAIESTRRGDEKRKRERERKKEQKEDERRREKEEIARLRNLKRQELEERLRRVEGTAGTKGWTEGDLEGDFDPVEWDRRMTGLFDESYYNDEDNKKPKFEDDIDITDIVPDEEEQEEDNVEEDGPQEEMDGDNVVKKKLTKREKLEKKRKIEEYLDEHLPLNAPKSSFRYREVSPTTFGLDPLEILTATDSQLNEFVGLKKLAPYRPREVKEGDLRKYGKKKRLREWRKMVSEEGEDEEIRRMFRVEKPKVPNGESGGGMVEDNVVKGIEGEEGRKKRRKSRKKGQKGGVKV